MNRSDFQLLSQIRIEDAQALFAARRFGGAYYFTGVAVECALKAAIAKLTAAHDFPPKPELVRGYYVHSLSDLLKHAGLEQQLTGDSMAMPELKRNWDTLKGWGIDARYSAASTAQTAGGILMAAANPQTGVLTWLKAFW